MLVKIWWIWMITAGVFFIMEMITAGFFLFWFGVGAAAAGLAALFGFSIPVQWGCFVVVSIALVAVSRKFADKIGKKQPSGIGADRSVGKKGVVLEEIDNINNTGRVRLEKEEWRAESDTGEVIQKGRLVEVVKLSGTHLVVKVI